ncbi:MAG TPA: hypothetical protein VNF68_11610 [Candidatus Baltobacteraceae bacterium]|nr:hypothetical protein [Candidatus Baltobacteraceae bacterium]
MTDGEREIWSEMQRDAAPTVSVWRTTLHRSRKDRVCSDCKRTIRAGEQYSKTFFVEDGEAGTIVSHPRGSMCWEINEKPEDDDARC